MHNTLQIVCNEQSLRPTMATFGRLSCFCKVHRCSLEWSSVKQVRVLAAATRCHCGLPKHHRRTDANPVRGGIYFFQTFIVMVIVVCNLHTRTLVHSELHFEQLEVRLCMSLWVKMQPLRTN